MERTGELGGGLNPLTPSSIRTLGGDHNYYISGLDSTRGFLTYGLQLRSASLRGSSEVIGIRPTHIA